MPDDSTFFSDKVGSNSGESAAPRLVHSSEGGWTQIWLIDKDGRFRALKSLKPSFRGQPRYESLLRKEYSIGYSLSHTAIREVYGFQEVPGLGNCIEMEWVDGMPLGEYLSSGRPQASEARKMVLQICDALSYIHSKQIVHRDIKPSNILVTHNGHNIKLIDFGLSDTDSSSVLKEPGGTASFAAPELLRGETADNRADIWSLGKVIALLLPGERSIIRKCTRPVPSDRFQDVSEVKAALSRRVSKPAVILSLAAALALAAAGFLFLRSPGAVTSGNPAAEPGTEVVDTTTIDELFRQASDMILKEGGQ